MKWRKAVLKLSRVVIEMRQAFTSRALMGIIAVRCIIYVSRVTIWVNKISFEQNHFEAQCPYFATIAAGYEKLLQQRQIIV